jgi:hypothetical protein
MLYPDEYDALSISQAEVNHDGKMTAHVCASEHDPLLTRPR